MEFNGATLKWQSEPGKEENFALQIGHVVRVADGSEYIIVAVRLHFSNSFSSLSAFLDANKTGGYLSQGRYDFCKLLFTSLNFSACSAIVNSTFPQIWSMVTGTV